MSGGKRSTADPKDMVALESLSGALFRAGRLAEAAPCLDMLTRIQPRRRDRWWALARSHEKARAWANACLAWCEVLALHPSDAKARARMSELLTLVAANPHMPDASRDEATGLRATLPRWKRIAERLKEICDRPLELEARRLLLAVDPADKKTRGRIVRLLKDLETSADPRLASLSSGGPA